MTSENWYLGLDVGEKRIGVAVGDNIVKIALPIAVIPNDDEVIINIEKLLDKYNVEKIIVGLPRNSQGEETAQSQFVRDFIEKLEPLDIPIILQDESLTSVKAEERLKARKKDYSREDIDAESAVIILSDFLEVSGA